MVSGINSMMGMKGIEGYLLVIARMDGRGEYPAETAARLAGCHLACDRPKHTLQHPSYPSLPVQPTTSRLPHVCLACS